MQPLTPTLSPQKRGEGEVGAALLLPQKTRYALRMAHPLARIIEQLKREPSRTGSIVITVFGDAIVPRGGSVWLGTLLEFFKALDIDSGVVRTAMSRLAADAWLERNKVGRNSFYRLAKSGRLTFDAATKHIYDPPPSGWTGRFELLLIGNSVDRDASREALKNAGFGSPLPGGWCCVIRCCRRLCCPPIGRDRRPAGSAARSIAGCLRRPNNGLTGTEATKPDPCRRLAGSWRAGSATSPLCYKNSLNSLFFVICWYRPPWEIGHV